MKFASDTVYFQGTSNIMYQPEFHDIEKLKKFVSLLEDSEVWRNLSANNDANQLSAVTPKGTELVWMDNLAIVASEIKLSKQDTVKMLVVGPSRMQYDKIVSILDYITKEIEKNYNK